MEHSLKRKENTLSSTPNDKILEQTDKENEVLPMNENFNGEVGRIGRETETIKNEPNGSSRTEKYNFWSRQFADWMQRHGRDGGKTSKPEDEWRTSPG